MSEILEVDDVLESEPPAASTAEVGNLLQRHFELSGSVRALSSERDLNFRVDTSAGSYLLKITNAAEDPQVTDLLTAALRHAGENRIKMANKINKYRHVILDDRILPYLEPAGWRRNALRWSIKANEPGPHRGPMLSRKARYRRGNGEIRNCLRLAEVFWRALQVQRPDLLPEVTAVIC